MSANQLHVNAAELLREPGLRRHVSAAVPPSTIGAEHDAIAGDIDAELDIVSTLDDLSVTGAISVPWHGSCRRCLAPITERLVVDVDERYAEQPAELDDAFPIVNGQLDVTQMVREHVLLAVADLRLCRPDCPGLCPDCGADLNAVPCDCDRVVIDDRWSTLDQLRHP